jgi:hypothetical protein
VAWPQPTDYNEAIQNPRSCFSDPELQAGEVVEDALGMPRPHSGNFADVYQIRSPNGRAWAVKCFTREVGPLQSRYHAISQHLRQGSPPFMVQFQYLPTGFKIGGKGYPVLKMDWVEGFTLNEFVRQYVDVPQVMYRLAKMWVKLSLQLRRANMAHADLQHGNALLVPGEKSSQLSLRLIDYDGMFVPALAKNPSGEVGHPNYQHPQRLAEGLYNSEVDRFPHLVIYTALRSLTVGGRELWDKYDNGENLLFREQDFRQSMDSQLLLDLWQLPDPDIRRLLGHLLIASQAPLDRVAMLDEVVGGEGRPLALTGGQERLVLDLLPPGAARMKLPPASVSQFSLEELIAETDDKPLSASRKAAARLAVAHGGGVTTKAAGAVASMPQSPTSREEGKGLLTPPPHVPAAGGGKGGGGSGPQRRATVAPLLFHWLQWRCRRCGNSKHMLESICPHCHNADWTAFALAAILTLGFLILACFGLSHHEPGLLGVLGALSGLIVVLMVPLAAGLLVGALLGPRPTHDDALQGIRWPTATEACPRCGKTNVMPLFCCRLCGRMSWARLAMVCALAITAAIVVAISQPSADAPGWWVILAMLMDWLGRLLSVAAAFAIFIGTLEVWRLQPRLPKEGRVFRSLADQAALMGATLVPVLCMALLVFGLYSR